MPGRIAKFEYYEAPDGWRWRFRARNGKIIFHGGEAFVSERGVKRAIDLVREATGWPYEIVKVEA